MTHDWISALATLHATDTAAVLVTVASAKGSTPRANGTKMIVTANEVHGTIGGGHLEFTAIDIARRQLDGAGAPELRRFPLGASLGQCCGGVVNLLFEPVPADADWVAALVEFEAQRNLLVIVTPVDGALRGGKLFVAPDSVRGSLSGDAQDEALRIARTLLEDDSHSCIMTVPRAGATAGSFFFDVMRPAGFQVMLFGAGHVGRALVNILGNLPCTVTWIDSRDDAFPEAIPANVTVVVTDAPEPEIDRAVAGCYCLVMTHDHALDQRITERILRGTDFAYLGLIGSLSKRRQFERRLAARGVPAAMLERIVCPIGVAGITGKEPGVIAVAVAAELLQRHAQFEAGRRAIADAAMKSAG